MGAKVTHEYSNGDYSATVVVSNQLGFSSTGTSPPISIDYLYNNPPTITGTNNSHFLGQLFTATALASDPNGGPIMVSWDFGDGSSSDGLSVTHQYAATGTYSMTVTATNSAKHLVSATTSAQVVTSIAMPPLQDNEFSPYCSGPFCGAASATAYSGDGVGIWRYHNSTGATATVDIGISGVSAGQRTALIFSNGQNMAAAALPDAGTLVASQRATLRTATGREVADPRFVAHTTMLNRNATFAREILGRKVTRPKAREVRLAAPRFGRQYRSVPPAIGTTRDWIDNFSTPVNYAMQVGATCALPDGRNAIFWVDSQQLARGAITLDKLTPIASSFCGSTGSYARLTAVVGAPYGPAATAFPDLIQDTAQAAQDIHIVIPESPTATWGGYFALKNLERKSVDPSSNEALAVFMIGWELSAENDGGRELGSTLIHEVKHMINFYQRTLVRQTEHAGFLEETSAMLAEDFIDPTVLDYSKSANRLAGYAESGGGSGYIGWVDSPGNAYNFGGIFGGFLHRRYGLAIDRKLITDCADHADPLESYRCVDQIIAGQGGDGFDDDFNRVGASVFGMIPIDGAPNGFGFPSRLVEGCVLDLLDTFSERLITPKIAVKPLVDGFLATSQTYQLDVIGDGRTVYTRTGVQVPAGTTLVVVITKPPESQ